MKCFECDEPAQDSAGLCGVHLDPKLPCKWCDLPRDAHWGPNPVALGHCTGFAPAEKLRVIVSLRSGLVSAIYGDHTKIDVVIVDHDNIEMGRGEGEDCGAYSTAIVPINQMTSDTESEVSRFDRDPEIRTFGEYMVDGAGKMEER